MKIQRHFKKRIIPTPDQMIIIKKRRAQGFNSEKIADMVDLPVSVIKRYCISVYFKVTNRETCAQCGKKFKKNKKQNKQNQSNEHKVICNPCKTKARNYDDIAFFSAIETCPSDMEDIKIDNKKDFEPIDPIKKEIKK